MALEELKTIEIAEKYGNNASDTGATPVQIAILTKRIGTLTKHMIANAKDKHSRRGLIALVNKRRKLLNYFKRHHAVDYLDLIKQLGIRK